MADGLQQVINYMIPAVGTPRSYFWSGVLGATPVNIDFRNVQGGNIDGQPFRPSGVFIDNTQGTGPLTIVVNEISYQMIALAGELLNLQFPAPVDVSVSMVGNGQATVAFVDFPVLPYRNLAVAGGTALWGSIAGILSDQVDLQSALDAKITDPGSAVNGEVLTYSGGVISWAPLPVTAISWGDIGGTLSAQTDLQSALDAKMSNPMTTPGDIIVAGALGAPGRLAVGTNGQVLMVSGGVPSWQAPGGGGGGGAAWEQIATWTYSSAVGNVDFIGLASYTEIMVVGDGVTSNSASIRDLRVSHDNGATFNSGATAYSQFGADGVETSGNRCLLHTVAATAARSFIAVLDQINLTSSAKPIRTNGGLATLYNGSTAPINALQIRTDGFFLTGGTITVYGRK